MLGLPNATPQAFLPDQIGTWGKLVRDDAGHIVDWLPLADHCVDVAVTFAALARLPSWHRALSKAAGRNLNETDVERLAVMAFFHDIGKANHGFQNKRFPDHPFQAGHVQELITLICHPDFQPNLLQSIDYWSMAGWFDESDGVLRMLVASASHHGKPLPLDGTRQNDYVLHWRSADGIDPMDVLAHLRKEAESVFPSAFSADKPPLSANPALQHCFAGLVMLADWIGSHRGFFPFHCEESERAVFSRRAADNAVDAIGLNSIELRQRTSDRSFLDLFGFKPTALQTSLFAFTGSPIIIAESDTGSGKTEAALGHYFKMWLDGKVDSLYFALPTRVAARELYERLLNFAQHAFGENHPPVLLAVPGYAQVDGESPETILPSADNLWQDDARTRRLERIWSGEMPKRFLAAPMAVGTIDQALLSVMQVGHAHLRASCLERSLLVVDEVHASDTYMRGLLRALLAHHRDAGSHALLLSATLGSDMRAELLTPMNKHHAPPDLAEAISQPYPALTDTSGVPQSLPGVIAKKPKTVQMDPRPWLDGPEQVLPELINALEDGARVLVVCNTVSRVLTLLRAAEQIPALSETLFRVSDRVCPHHGRFARVDRTVLDQAVSQRLGKGTPSGPVLLIGSQTLEQSLDIDADWLITDLCPIDVMLQRIGRLHRHERDRPAGFEDPRCTIFAPSDESFSSFFDARGETRAQAGLGNVYPDLRIARLTLELVQKYSHIEIPRQNRELVEGATHPQQLARFSDGPWARHRDALMGMAMNHGQLARNALIRRDISFGEREQQFGSLANQELSTRLGLDNRTITLPYPVISPFGQRLTEMSIPGWMARGINAETLDAPPETTSDGLLFSFGGKHFRYTRLGLESLS